MQPARAKAQLERLIRGLENGDSWDEDAGAGEEPGQLRQWDRQRLRVKGGVGGGGEEDGASSASLGLSDLAAAAAAEESVDDVHGGAGGFSFVTRVRSCAWMGACVSVCAYVRAFVRAHAHVDITVCVCVCVCGCVWMHTCLSVSLCVV
jgi:hypothetical protein